MSKKMLVMENKQFNYSKPTRSNSEFFGNNTVNNNYNISIKLSNIDLWLDNFKSFK